MADETYDAIVIGGGAKGLITANYLAKYGGMSVAIFEQKHEMGGGWCTDEGAVPGFVFDYHCIGVRPHYHLPTQRDFPEWNDEYGQMTKQVEFETGAAAIFKEDQSSIICYDLAHDPDQELTAKQIAKFSQKDADTWRSNVLEIYHLFHPVFLEWVHNPAVPVGEMDVLDKLMLNPRFDQSWHNKSFIGVLRDMFESEALIAFFIRAAQAGGRVADLPGMGALQLMWTLGIALQGKMNSHGAHNMAHAAVKMLQSYGGKTFTSHWVDKVTIENGKATGVRLADGTEVKARKLVLSTLDPYSLVFRLTGKEYYEPRTVRRVEHLERRYTCVCNYFWALRERPVYNAAQTNPDINHVDGMFLICKDPEVTVKQQHLRANGIMPTEIQIGAFGYAGDKLRYPEGKFGIATETFVVPANQRSEKYWLDLKKPYAEDQLKTWQHYSPNMTWNNVIGYWPQTPYDIALSLPNMGPEGNWAVIDNIPGQLGKFRPTPELARHKTPIKNLYATGSAWHPNGCGSCWQGYNCYKIIAEDLDLKKPWEGQPW